LENDVQLKMLSIGKWFHWRIVPLKIFHFEEMAPLENGSIL